MAAKKCVVDIGGGVCLSLAEGAEPRQALDYASALMESLEGTLTMVATASTVQDHDEPDRQQLFWALSHLAAVASAALDVGTAAVLSANAPKGGSREKC